MKFGHVLRKEREGKTGLNRSNPYEPDEMAKRLGIAPTDYAQLEADDSPAEKWFCLLCNLAVKLGAPTSRLLAESGRSADCAAGRAGPLIRARREERGFTVEEMAELLGVSVEEYVPIEKGTSPIETYGPLLLRFAELIDQPVFNLFLPCGLPYAQLNDYP